MRRVCEAEEVLVDEKKKKRRNGRRFNYVSTSSVTEIRGEVPKHGENGKSEICPSDELATLSQSFNLSTAPLSIRVNGITNSENNRSSHNQTSGPSNLGWKVVSESSSEAITCEASSSMDANAKANGNSSLPSDGQTVSSPCTAAFAPHWSVDAVNDALERGEVFKACFRVNAYNRHEAYCTIDGLPTDVLISGLPSQNRAVEGDIVAVKVDSPQWWQKMKGSIPNGINTVPLEDVKLSSESNHGTASSSYDGRSKVNGPDEYACLDSCIITWKEQDSEQATVEKLAHSIPTGSSGEPNHDTNPIGRLCTMVSSFPLKRPTGKVVAVIQKSAHRDAIVGFLNAVKLISVRETTEGDGKMNEFVQLRPNDPKYPQLMIPVEGLPYPIKVKLDKGDSTVKTELVGARICSWTPTNLLPHACITQSFGHGSTLEAQICAILFENSICTSLFAPGTLDCLPEIPWVVPSEELQSRRDLRNVCVFTIDPSTATDLDDALSVERLNDDVFRVGVHIADVSYFILPDTELDKEARIRSTSVYMVRKKFPMLPRLLSENVGSLCAGLDRLAFSVFLDINLSGDVVDRSIGRTVIRSCCKLSYEQVQEIIDGTVGSTIPTLCGQFEWLDVVKSVKDLHELSKSLREKRYNNGALFIESSQVEFLFDKYGNPYDCVFRKRIASNSLVEEFMLLANRTVAEIIHWAFPDRALLRRHGAPNQRKLRELKLFCDKHGFELDTSSSGRLNMSLQKIGEELYNDSSLLDVLMTYASRPMQRAAYICSGDSLLDENEWGHYSLSVPFYTHFTSPLRRYPDIVVHRLLAAVIEAEATYQSRRGSETRSNCFTGIDLDKDVAKSPEVREALLLAARKHGVLGTESLSELTSFCNNRKIACNRVRDSCDVLYMWALLKSKEGLFSEARILSLGPRFMSVYIHKFAIERRINFDDVQGLTVMWLEATSTVILNFNPGRRSSSGRGNSIRWRSIEDFACIISPRDTNIEPVVESASRSSESKPDPPFFPLTLRVFSTIPVALCAIGGEGGAIDIGVRMYVSSYFC